MNLFIPPLGTEIELSEPWSFQLHFEYRNFAALEYFKLTKNNETKWDHWRDDLSYPLTLPAGTVLKVDRIYIRKGVRDFDSVTFYMKGEKKKIRFWAKLPEVNKIIIKDIV